MHRQGGGGCGGWRLEAKFQCGKMKRVLEMMVVVVAQPCKCVECH